MRDLIFGINKKPRESGNFGKNKRPSKFGDKKDENSNPPLMKNS